MEEFGRVEGPVNPKRDAEPGKSQRYVNKEATTFTDWDNPPLSNLTKALSQAQKETYPPRQTKKVDFIDKSGRRVNYSYADLSDVIECIRQPLAKNELAVTHQLEFNFGVYGLTTYLLHSSGERLKSFYPLPTPFDCKPQEMGSAITYARRYSLSSLLGIASEEDDDGSEASGGSANQKNALPKPKISPKKEDLAKPKVSAKRAEINGRLKIIYPAFAELFPDTDLSAEMMSLFGVSESRFLDDEQLEEFIGFMNTQMKKGAPAK